LENLGRFQLWPEKMEEEVEAWSKYTVGNPHVEARWKKV